jgi:hypothetical protein
LTQVLQPPLLVVAHRIFKPRSVVNGARS